jgi:hypothetical protein
VFVPLTLRRFQVIRRTEVERLAEKIAQDTAHAYLPRWWLPADA